MNTYYVSLLYKSQYTAETNYIIPKHNKIIFIL